jgi:hypothetical protein
MRAKPMRKFAWGVGLRARLTHFQPPRATSPVKVANFWEFRVQAPFLIFAWLKSLLPKGQPLPERPSSAAFE